MTAEAPSLVTGPLCPPRGGRQFVYAYMAAPTTLSGPALIAWANERDRQLDARGLKVAPMQPPPAPEEEQPVETTHFPRNWKGQPAPASEPKIDTSGSLLSRYGPNGSRVREVAAKIHERASAPLAKEEAPQADPRPEPDGTSEGARAGSPDGGALHPDAELRAWGSEPGGAQHRGGGAGNVVAGPAAASGVRATSMEAYQYLRSTGKLGAQQLVVVECFVSRPGLRATRQELARDLGLGINVVCGRVNELMTAEPPILVERGRKQCEVTARDVNALELAGFL